MQPEALPHAGSGVVVSDRGHVLTHACIVEGAHSVAIEVAHQDRRTRAGAVVVARDDRTGLVLLRSSAVSRWVLRWRSFPPAAEDREGPRGAGKADPAMATACGWPFIALSGARRHPREMVSAFGPLSGDTLDFPLPPGYEGGPVADENARGIGIIGPTFDTRGVRRRPSFIRAEEALRFLARHGLTPPPERADHDRSRQVKLGWLMNSTVQVERLPARAIEPGMPRLCWSASVAGGDIFRLAFAGQDARLQLVAEWRPTGRSRQPDTTHSEPPGVSRWDVRTGHPETDKRPPAAPVRPARYRRDRLGGLREVAPDGGLVRDLAMVNGCRGFNAVGPLEASLDGRLLLAGDALIWADSGTVLWHTDTRADDLLRLSPDGVHVAHAPAGEPGNVSLWRLPPITP